MKSSNKISSVFLNMHPLLRFLLSAILAFITYLLTKKNKFDVLLELLLLWDVFALSYIISNWVVIFKRSTKQIREVATKEDGSRAFVFALIILASFASMLTVLLLILSKQVIETAGNIYLPVAVGGMMLSWIMVHTLFTFHYAHLYYNDDEKDAGQCAEGLNFPDEKNPDYLDFAYFSFVIGMTFQVSDVEISSKKIRRLALLHGLLSFGLNTFVVALTINVIAGLKD